MTDRTHFVDLVRSRREQLHLSYLSLAAAAVDPETGESMSTGWLHRLETGKPVNAPSFAVLRALAAGLNLPLARLQQAAGAQFFGMETGGRYSVEALQLAERLGNLTDKQRDAVIALLDAFLPPASK
ncbi:helix-turn-helix transcriptional regulator [Streptomyces sp. NPDC096030]|uniref:helix-turn-helix domain-containing protein n=1 Tax=Streptomyces sp. NPDC096030 TaxID=3155423 RepID=UPI003318EFDB